MDNQFRHRLLQALDDPKTARQLEQLLDKEPSKEPTTFAPFYRNKGGKITKGHLNIERHKRDLELTPIFEEEAMALGLLPQKAGSPRREPPPRAAPEGDLNRVSDEALADLRLRAQALGVANWQMKKAARLRGDITKAELKLKARTEHSVTDNAADNTPDETVDDESERCTG